MSFSFGQISAVVIHIFNHISRFQAFSVCSIPMQVRQDQNRISEESGSSAFSTPEQASESVSLFLCLNLCHFLLIIKLH